MKSSDIPTTRLVTPFAASADPGFRQYPIPVAASGLDPGRASLEKGFPSETFVPVGAGGTPPDGRDMNGVLYETTGWTRWMNAGGAMPWDSGFSAAISGYPQNAIVGSTVTIGLEWISIVDDNVTNPDTGGAGWLRYPAGAIGTIFNVQQFTTSTRVSMTGVSGNSWRVTAWTPTPYVKQSATSKLIVQLCTPTYTPGPTGCTTGILTIGGVPSSVLASNNIPGQSAGQTVVNTVLTIPSAGSKAVTLDFARFDNFDWTTIFDPTSSDNAYFPATTTSVLIIGELG